MDKTLYAEINGALKNRGDWADRQATCYKMRNGGVRRTSKPYPNAPDGWYPLGDTLIEKLKPAYIQQMYGGETIANFVCLRAQDQELTASAGYWFDYQLKQRSNFERTMFVSIDQMLEQAFTPVKVYYDAQCKCLAFDQVDPLHLIVPDATQEYNQNGGTEWIVHVLHLSVPEYEANPKFKQDDDFVKQIKGTGKSTKDSGDTSGKEQNVGLKEGINYSNNKNEIILWEVYKRDRKAKKITIETISPLLPCEESENVVRPEFGMPYNQGIFSNGQTFPFFKIRAEIKGKGHYSSRGIIEINAPFEMSLTKSWNTIHEHMDFSSQPNYSNSGVSALPSGNNFKTKPGAILPPGLTLAEHPSPPASLSEDMQMTRAIAEDRTQIPDLGASEHLTDRSRSGKNTATQINAIVAQSGQGSDMKARVFRMDLAEGLKMAWGIALQYLANAVDAQGRPDTMSLSYVVENEIEQITPQALHAEYEITPNGSADSWNKGALVAKRMAYFDKFQGNPYVPLDELTKWVMEADDPRNVKRLFRDPGIAAKDQEEAQAMECLLMKEGFGPQVHPADDDKIHLMNLAQFAENKIQRNEMTPELAQLVLTHGAEHGQQLVKKKDPKAKQIEAQIAPLAQVLGQIAQSGGAHNILPMQPAGQPAAPAASASFGKNDPVGDASKLMNSLASLIKAGVPITHDELNKTLAGAGLPPLPMTQPIVPPQHQLQGTAQ